MAAAMVSSQQGKAAGESVDDHHHPRLPKVDDPVVLRTCTVDEAFRRMEELVGSEEEQKNWKGIVIALLVIAFILGMIALAIALVTPAAEKYEPGAPMLFSMLTDESYQLKQPIFSWVKGTNTHALYIDQETGAEDGSVERHVRLTNTDDGSQSTLVPQDVISSIGGKMDGVQASPDTNYALLKLNTQTDYVTSLSSYTVYERTTHSQKKLGSSKLQYATWIGRGHELIYVEKNNIFYKNNLMDDAVANVTVDGSSTTLYGLPDKLYREYIRPDIDNLIWPSPKNSKFIYAKVDLNAVYSYTDSDAPTALDKKQRRTTSTTLYVFDRKSEKLHLPTVNGYVTAVTWMDADKVLVLWLNSNHRKEQHIICDCSNQQCYVHFEYIAHGEVNWVGLYGDPIYNDAKKEYYTILPDPDNPSQLYRHVAAIKVNGLKSEPIFLTSHSCDDIKLLGLYKSDLLYLSTGYNYTQQHIYSVNPKNSFSRCLTCDGLSKLTSDAVGYVEGEMSPKGSSLYLSILGPSFPTFYLVNTEGLLTGNISGVQIDGSHHASLISVYENIHLPMIEYLTVKLDGNVEAAVKLILPPIFDRSKDCLYETVLVVNDLPGARTATQKFSLGFQEYLAKNQSYIIALADVRGSGGRGERVRQAIHDGLGNADSYDIIKVIEFLRKENETYKVDGDRVAVLGSSYGGFVALHAASRGGFNCAVVTSPITSLSKYEWWLKERYMNNATTEVALMYNCDESSRTCSLPDIDELLVLHGIADVVVTVDNTLELIKHLQMADYTFRQQMYPEVGHYLEKSDVASHYYQTITNFLYECFEVESRIDDSSVNYCENRKLDTQ